MTLQTIVAALLCAIGLSKVDSKGIRALEPNEISPRIVGGRVADESRYEYARVSLQDRIGHSCGGSVIAPDVILSAAHCAAAFDRVVVGLYNVSDSENAEEFGIVKKYVHSGYDDFTMRHDVMLVKLDGNITLVDPVRINADAAVPTTMNTLTAVGWGATRVTKNEIDYPDLMNEVDVNYIPPKKCRNMRDSDGFTLFGQLSPDMMCAWDDGKDSCYGDSGGPLLILGDTLSEDVQVGIVSWGIECGGKLPGVYHRISASYGWIQKNMCEISDSPPDHFNCNSPAPTTSPASTASARTTPTAAPTKTPVASSAPLRRLGYGSCLMVLFAALL